MVLLDVEWIEPTPGNKYITQIAAIRVKETWELEDQIELLVRPWDTQLCFANHLGLGEYPAEMYLSAPREEEALWDFAQWLRPEDRLCFWHYEGMLLLQDAWKRALGRRMGHFSCCANHKVWNAIQSLRVDAGNPYKISETLGLEVPFPQHRACNDVKVLYDLLVALATNKSGLKPVRPLPQPKKKKSKVMTAEEAKAARRRYTLDGSPFEYFYSLDSQVFHTRSCHLIHRIKNIQGCLRYRTAAENRQPCKLCKPQKKDASKTLPTLTREEQELKARNEEVIRARMLGGDTIEIKRGKLVGCCHNIIHPGKMNKALLLQHDCLGKNCPFFQKYPESPYWADMERKAKARETQKEKKRKSKEAALAAQSALEQIRESFQACADETQSNMHIVRVEQPKADIYTVYYVSDNPFADGNPFQPFTAAVEQRHRCRRVQLKHIRDVDGHFVTREEFHLRTRKCAR